MYRILIIDEDNKKLVDEKTPAIFATILDKNDANKGINLQLNENSSTHIPLYIASKSNLEKLSSRIESTKMLGILLDDLIKKLDTTEDLDFMEYIKENAEEDKEEKSIYNISKIDLSSLDEEN